MGNMGDKKMLMHADRLRSLILIVLFLNPLAAPTAELRTWTDLSGKFSVKAKFVSEGEGKVTLEREDGAKFSIPVDRLSLDDQKLLAELTGKPMTTENESNPFERVEGPDKNKPRLIKNDIESVPKITPTPVNKVWSITEPVLPNDRQFDKAVPLPKNPDGKLAYTDTVVNQTCGRAIIGYHYEKDKVRYLRVVLVDVESGRTLPFDIEAPENEVMTPFALLDDGSRVLMRRSAGRGKYDRMELWSLSSSGVKREIQWYPYDHMTGDSRAVTWAAALKGNRVVTVNKDGRTIIWDAIKGLPIFRYVIQWQTSPGLSPDRRYLCHQQGGNIAVLDLEKGEVICQQAHGGMVWSSVRFSASGKRVVIFGARRLKVWDFASGDSVLDVGLPARGKYIFPHDNYLLINANSLFDIERQVVIWKYGGSSVATMMGQTCWFAIPGGGGQSGAMIPAKIPDTIADEAIKKATADPDFWILRKGTNVRVVVDAISNAKARNEVATELKKRLEAQGFQVSDSAEVDLIASVAESKERKQVSYSVGFSPFARGKPYAVRQFVSRLKVVSEEETYWETSGDNIPKSISRSANIEQVLRDSEKPNYDWFKTVALPKIVTKSTGAGPLGTTNVTTNGLK